MSLTTPYDIPLTITVPSDPSSSATSRSTSTTAPLIRTERRITPTWTISELKSKLEPITGIPSSSQSLRTLSVNTGTYTPLTPDSALVGDPRFSLTKGTEIEVLDLRPPGSRDRYDDVSCVEKFVMPTEQYERLDDSVLAWKRRQGLGRFASDAKPLDVLVRERREGDSTEIARKGVSVGLRCLVNGSDERRGVVRYVGEIEGLGGDRERGCVWVGVEFDEPVGRNDGSCEVEVVENGKKGREMKRVFQTKGRNYGGLVRPQTVEVGEEFGVLDDLVGSDMEEI